MCVHAHMLVGICVVCTCRKRHLYHSIVGNSELQRLALSRRCCLKILPGDLMCPDVGFSDGRRQIGVTLSLHILSQGAFLLDRAASLEGMGDRPEEHLVIRLTATHRHI